MKLFEGEPPILDRLDRLERGLVERQREADAALVEAAENWIESFLSKNAPYKADGQLAYEIASYLASKIRGPA